MRGVVKKIGKRAAIGLILMLFTAIAMVDGTYSPAQALTLMNRMWPVLLFALAMGIVAALARQAHFFHVSAHYVHVLSRGNFLALFLIFCALTVACTVFLSIDTAAVMLTPAAIALATACGKGTRPLAYAVIWLANMSSLLLPVSNLTNLLAMQRADFLSTESFPSTPLRFAQLTWLPWLICTLMPIIAVLVLERAEFMSPGRTRAAYDPRTLPPLPAALTPSPRPTNPEIRNRGLLIRSIVIITLLCVALALGVTPWLASCIGAALLALSAVLTPGVTLPRGLIPYKMMTLVVGLFFITDLLSTVATPLIAHLSGSSPFLLAFSGAGLANITDNLPAYLALEPAATSTGSLIALLIGVNAGPIVTPWASLATLLWYEQLVAEGHGVNWARFMRRGLILAPLTVACATAASLLLVS